MPICSPAITGVTPLDEDFPHNECNMLQDDCFDSDGSTVGLSQVDGFRSDDSHYDSHEESQCDGVIPAMSVSLKSSFWKFRDQVPKKIKFDKVVMTHEFEIDHDSTFIRYDRRKGGSGEAVPMEDVTGRLLSKENKFASAKSIEIAIFRAEVLRTAVESGREAAWSCSKFVEIQSLPYRLSVSPSKWSSIYAVTADPLDHTTTPMSAAGVRPDKPEIWWLMDTGCGQDLVSQKTSSTMSVTSAEEHEKIDFQTANGRTHSDQVAVTVIPELNESIRANVLADTPSVISIGRRCMKMGYSFHWPEGRRPFMIRPDGKKISFRVRGNIPYLFGGDSLCFPKVIRPSFFF